MKSNDESGEACLENIEIAQPCVPSSVAGMNSSTDSFSEIAVGKVPSMAPDASTSDDCFVQSKFECRGVSEANDDCYSCGSGTDEHANRLSNNEDSRVKYNTQKKISGENSEVPSSSLQAGLYIQNRRLMETSLTKSTDAADSHKVQNTLSQDSNQIPMDAKDMPSDTKNELLEGSTNHLVMVTPGGVAPADHPESLLNSIEKNDDMDLETHPANETDDSDMVEDVKVCDICGDAGREDLLAICSRCSDGAEHTYCMREMLAKVPEGEWLCEECKTFERVPIDRQEKAGRMDENEKNNSSGQASSEHVNSSDVEGHKTKGHMKMPCKRPRDDADTEVSSIAKKPSLDFIVGSPKTSSSNKPAVISRESSSKNLLKGRLQASHNSSSGTAHVNDAAELPSASDLRAHNFRGTFSKSNSFNSLNSKPKVKLVDQIVIQRQKSAREYGSFRLKEGAVRSIGKSMSFKSTNASQTETKMKMASPRLSDNMRDIKNMKQRNPFELQRLSRAENSSTNLMKGAAVSPTSRVEKRTASRGDSSSATIVNHHEMKPALVEGKSAAALSRSSSLAGRRTSDLSNSLGEVKRPLTSTPGASSMNMANNIDKRSNQNSVKEEISSVIERPPFNANESSGSRFIPSFVKSSRDDSDNLKAAIEAAVLKKPGVYRKHRAVGQPDDSSVPSLSGKKKLSCDAEPPDRSIVARSSTVDSFPKEIPNNVKHSSLGSGEGALPSEGQDSIDVGPSSGDTIINVSAAVPLLPKSLAIPEHEYIWQGCFEIYRGGKLFDLWEGIQAHVSTCASPKVVEAANKFKNRIVLYEVPRLSTWPIHFQEHGVTEDSIALFFFARDLESYDKFYKVLLDNMMKNDLALKGNVNGVELLIFPSNQLPIISQRWNMLFFLWGVFRGKKANCLQDLPESLKQFYAPRDIPPPIMSLPDNRCSQKPVAEDLLATEDVAPVQVVPSSEKLRSLLSSSPLNGVFGAKVPFLDQVDCNVNSSSSSVHQSGAKNNLREMDSCQEVGTNPSSSSGSIAIKSSGREEIRMQLDVPLDRLQSSHPSGNSAPGNIGDKIGEGTISGNSAAHNFGDKIGEGTISDIACTQNEKLRTDGTNPSRDGEAPSKNEGFTGDLNEEPDCTDEFPETYVGPQTQYAAAIPLPMRNHATSGALENANHLASGSDLLQGQHNETCADTLRGECNDNTEMRFFPIEVQPEKSGNLGERSMPWKMHLLEQDQLCDGTPNLDLALGADSCPRSLDVQPLLVNKVEQKVNEEHILKEAGPKAEDDISATLSLSLSFPFPEKELSTEAAPKTRRLLSERGHMNNNNNNSNTSMLLFGNLGDK